MKIVVVSDTHGDISFINKLVTKYPDCDYYIHAGDSGLKEAMLDPFITVQGNCDYNIRNRYRIIEIGDMRMYVFHGDRFPLDVSLLSALAKENNCNILIHGHTHKSYYEFINGVHILCPGSIRYPRDGSCSYVLLYDENDKLKVEIKKYES